MTSVAAISAHERCADGLASERRQAAAVDGAVREQLLVCRPPSGVLVGASVLPDLQRGLGGGQRVQPDRTVGWILMIPVHIRPRVGIKREEDQKRCRCHRALHPSEEWLAAFRRQATETLVLLAVEYANTLDAGIGSEKPQDSGGRHSVVAAVVASAMARTVLAALGLPCTRVGGRAGPANWSETHARLIVQAFRTCGAPGSSVEPPPSRRHSSRTCGGIRSADHHRTDR